MAAPIWNPENVNVPNKVESHQNEISDNKYFS